jgi:hypothetical protein
MGWGLASGEQAHQSLAWSSRYQPGKEAGGDFLTEIDLNLGDIVRSHQSLNARDMVGGCPQS